MKKFALLLSTMACLTLTVGCPGGAPGTPGTPGASVSPGTPGTGGLVTKQDYIRLVECWVSKVPTPEAKVALEQAKTSINLIPDAQWNLSMAQYSAMFDSWKQAYASLGCN